MTAPTNKTKKRFLLSALVSGSIRARLLSAEMNEVAIALEEDVITAEGAVTWLDYINATDFINVEPFAQGTLSRDARRST